MRNQNTPFQYVPERGGAKFQFLKYWSRIKLPGNKVAGYRQEMRNQNSSFQYVPEMGGAKIYFLKYWCRENILGDKVVGCCLEMQNNYSPFHYVPERGGTKVYFLKCCSGKKNSGNKVAGYRQGVPNKYFSFWNCWTESSRNGRGLIIFSIILGQEKTFRKQSCWVLLGDAKSIFSIPASSRNGRG